MASESPKLSVGLPVMLHSEDEIQAFLAAKTRIESLGRDYGIPMDVGAFLFLHPRFALKPDNLEAAQRNQIKYQLPIIQVETPLQGRESLVFDDVDARKFGGESLLDRIVDHTIKLKEQDKSGIGLTIDTHIGVLVSGNLDDENPFPGVYSPQGYVTRKEEIHGRVKHRFDQLAARTGEAGHSLVLETVPYVTFEKKPWFSEPRAWFYPLSTLEQIGEISGGNITFDSAHLATSRSLPSLVRRNSATDIERIIFEIYGISSWSEYLAQVPTLERSMASAKSVHLGNSSGIGLHLPAELGALWGDGGTEGFMAKSELGAIVRDAHATGKPMIMEADYDVRNIPTNQFKEADEFLKYALSQ